jgi:hypothetical protein
MATPSKFSASAVSTEPDKSAHSFILTGRPGIGKTYFVSTVDRCFIIPIEEGLKGASPEHRPAHFTVVPRTLAELEQALDVFASTINAPAAGGKRPFGHVALDSLSGIEALIHDAACAEENVRHMEGKEYNKVWAAALPLFARIQRKLDAIRRTGTHVWLIAHAQEVVDANEDGETFRRWDLAFRGNGSKAMEVRNLWRQWADHVLFLDWDLSVRSQKGKRTVGKLRARILRCRESGFAFAKTRARIPDTLPATWEDLRRAMAAGTPASEAKLRSQIQELLGKLTDDDAALIKADLAKASTANRLAAVLSRAQGMAAVERANQADVTPTQPEEPAQAEAASPYDPDTGEVYDEPAEALTDTPEPVVAEEAPVPTAIDEPEEAHADERATYEALASETKRLIDGENTVDGVTVALGSFAKEGRSAYPDVWDGLRVYAFTRRVDLCSTPEELQRLVGEITAAKLPKGTDTPVRAAYTSKLRALRGAS